MDVRHQPKVQSFKYLPADLGVQQPMHVKTAESVNVAANKDYRQMKKTHKGEKIKKRFHIFVSGGVAGNLFYYYY